LARSDDIYKLPEGLPVPVDDGACDHLPGANVPSVDLISTAGRLIDLSVLEGRIIVFCYPRTGRPDVEPPAGWNEIPGARGCTPEACSIRDLYRQLKTHIDEVFGLSTQGTEYQREAVSRLHLPYGLLSDTELKFSGGLRLPTFKVESMTLIKRLTLVIDNGKIEKVFYPVFPPDKHGEELLRWLDSSGPEF